MGDDNTNQKKRKLTNANKGKRPKTRKTKGKVYKELVKFIEVETYPTEADENEANISDLVYSIISTILFDFRRKTGHPAIKLTREKEIVTTDSETGGTEEFVVLDLISVTEEKVVLVVEAKRSSLGQAMKQCLLAMKDARDNNSGGEVYGFVTTGESWRMIRYDGTFQITDKMEVLFDTMGGRQREMVEGLLHLGGLLHCCIEQRRHRGEIIEGEYLVELFLGGVEI